MHSMADMMYDPASGGPLKLLKGPFKGPFKGPSGLAALVIHQPLQRILLRLELREAFVAHALEELEAPLTTWKALLTGRKLYKLEAEKQQKKQTILYIAISLYLFFSLFIHQLG